MHEHSTAHTPAVPRSIIKSGKHNSNTPIQQWPQSPLAQQQQHQQQQQTTTSTVMSNLSPDDSAKTMMTNVSRMVETLGSAVNTLARESANTNDTMKNMMMQQTATMNNLMLIMTRNEERRQEVPISILQQTSTPSSTITNSQYSLSQQSSANKRKYGKNGDEATAASTVETETEGENMEEGEVVAEMEDDSLDEIEEQIEAQQQEHQQKDVIMKDDEQNQAKQQETATSRANKALAEGDFDTQFPKLNDKFKKNAPFPGVNQQ